MTQIEPAKPDWVIEAEAKLWAFSEERKTLPSVNERILTTFRALLRTDRNVGAA